MCRTTPTRRVGGEIPRAKAGFVMVAGDGIEPPTRGFSRGSPSHCMSLNALIFRHFSAAIALVIPVDNSHSCPELVLTEMVKR